MATTAMMVAAPVKMRRSRFSFVSFFIEPVLSHFVGEQALQRKFDKRAVTAAIELRRRKTQECDSVRFVQRLLKVRFIGNARLKAVDLGTWLGAGIYSLNRHRYSFRCAGRLGGPAFDFLVQDVALFGFDPGHADIVNAVERLLKGVQGGAPQNSIGGELLERAEFFLCIENFSFCLDGDLV